MYKILLPQSVLTISLIIVCLTYSYSQKGNKSLSSKTNTSAGANVQINSKFDSLYADYDNEIDIRIPAPYNIYGIAISQGVIRNINDSAKNISGLNILSDLKTGFVTVTIYKNNQVFKQRTFGIREKIYPQYARRITEHIPIQPIISLAGIDSGNIKRDILKQANKLVINRPYKILKYSLILQPDNLVIYRMNTIYFNDEIKQILNWYNMNNIIIIEDIYIEDSEGNIYRYDHPILYKVIF